MANLNKEKKHHFIYKTTNLLNGKYYIGMHSTCNLEDGYIGSGTRLRYSIRKHGIENFKCEILEWHDNRESLVNRERELITEDLVLDQMCMNLKPGGNGGFCSEEHKRRCNAGSSEHQKRMWKNDEYREIHTEINRQTAIKSHKGGKMGNFKCDWTGRKHREETKVKIGKANSIKQQGRGNSQFGTCWITDGYSNKKIKKSDPVPRGWRYGRSLRRPSGS